MLDTKLAPTVARFSHVKRQGAMAPSLLFANLNQNTAPWRCQPTVVESQKTFMQQPLLLQKKTFGRRES